MNKRVAVEISVTTGLEHELANARKCLKAGFAHVALVSPQQRFRARLQAALADFDLEDQARMAVYAPEEFLSWLASQPQDVRRVAGYRVTSATAPLGENLDAARARRERLNQVIAGSLKRLG